MKLVWVGKKNGASNADVSISMVKNGKNGRQTSFRFRNNSHFRICNNFYIQYAIADSRIYFKQGSEKAGFKINIRDNGKRNGCFKTKDFISNAIGDYDLLYDKVEDLNYIDFSKKK